MQSSHEQGSSYPDSYSSIHHETSKTAQHSCPNHPVQGMNNNGFSLREGQHSLLRPPAQSLEPQPGGSWQGQGPAERIQITTSPEGSNPVYPVSISEGQPYLNESPGGYDLSANFLLEYFQSQNADDGSRIFPHGTTSPDDTTQSNDPCSSKQQTLPQFTGYSWAPPFEHTVSQPNRNAPCLSPEQAPSQPHVDEGGEIVIVMESGRDEAPKEAVNKRSEAARKWWNRMPQAEKEAAAEKARAEKRNKMTAEEKRAEAVKKS